MFSPQKLYRQGLSAARNLRRKSKRIYKIDKYIIDNKADDFPVLNTAMNIIEDTARAEDTDGDLNKIREKLLKSYFENKDLRKYLEAVIRRDIEEADEAKRLATYTDRSRHKDAKASLKMARETRDILSLYSLATNKKFVDVPEEPLTAAYIKKLFKARQVAECEAIGVMKKLLRMELTGRPEDEILIDKRFKKYELRNKYPYCTPPADDAAADDAAADGADDAAADDAAADDAAADDAAADGADGDDGPAAAPAAAPAPAAADSMQKIPIEVLGGRKSRTRKSKIQHKKSHKKNSKKHHKKSKKHPKRKNKKTYRKY